MRIGAVFFDIGETLIDETRTWSLLADWLGIPPMTMFAVLGRVIAEGKDHRDVLPAVRPDLTWAEVVRRFRAEVDDRYLAEDLYPDARPCLQELQRAGYFVGVVGNQPPEREWDLMAMKLPADLIATSGRWGVKKPDAAFFDRIVSESGFPPEEVAYVGDRADNDVSPAADAGLTSIHIVRGAWGFIQRDWPEARRAKAQLTTLAELPHFLKQLNQR